MVWHEGSFLFYHFQLHFRWNDKNCILQLPVVKPRIIKSKDSPNKKRKEKYMFSILWTNLIDKSCLKVFDSNLYPKAYPYGQNKAPYWQTQSRQLKSKSKANDMVFIKITMSNDTARAGIIVDFVDSWTIILQFSNWSIIHTCW